MKKPVKISLIVIGTIFFIIILVSILISPLSKRYIEKNSQELIGRTVKMDKFRFNIFTGSLKIVGFDMKEQNMTDNFFMFDSLFVQVKLFDLLKHRVTVKKIHLSNTYLNIWQKKSEFNFDDLLKKFNTPDTVPAVKEEESKPWDIGIYDIRLRNGNILYKDLVVNSVWDMKDLNLIIPGIYLSGKETDVGFDLLFTDGGKLSSKLEYDIEKSNYHIHLDLERFSIKGLLPYMQQDLKLGSLSGLLDAHLTITGDTDHVMNSSVQGTVSMESLEMRDDRNELVVSAEQLGMDMKEVNVGESKYILNGISSHGVSTRYVMEKDSSSNFTYLFKESDTEPVAKDTTEKTQPEETFTLEIGTVDLNGIHVELRDNTLQMPFTYQFKDINIKSQNFNPDKSNIISIKGNLGATGMASIHWNGNMNDLSNLNLVLEMNSVDIRDFTPYSMEYFAYPLTNGILTFSSQNIITNNMLVGTNNVDVFKCEVDKVHKEVKAKMKVPLRLAVYVLKNREDKIKLNLPVKGDIRSPQFSYKKIILAALVNVLVKVSMAPLDFLAGSMGFDAKQLEDIEFSPLQEEFTSDQYDRFNQLSEILLAKPDLLLDIKQDINYTRAAREQAMANLKKDFYLDQHSGKKAGELELVDLSEITGIKDSDPGLIKYATSVLPDNPESDIYAKSIMIYRDSLDMQVGRLAGKRMELLKEYMVSRRQVPPEKIKVETIPQVAGKVYNQKNLFRTNLSLPGEDILTPADSTQINTTITQ